MTAVSESANIHHTLAVHGLEVFAENPPGDAGPEDHLMLHKDGAFGGSESRALAVASGLRRRRASSETDATIIAGHRPRTSDCFGVVKTASSINTTSRSGPEDLEEICFKTMH